MRVANVRGWRERDGLIIPPEGSGIGWIQLQAKAAWADLSTLVNLQLSSPGLEVEVVSTPRPIVTIEGEDAALVTVRGRFNGNPIQRDLGYVFGDGFVSCISSVVLEPARFRGFTEVVGQLVASARLGLGQRRRAVRHTPPAGWRIGGGSDPVSYHAPDDPFVRIDVWAAAPRTSFSARDYLAASPDLEIERKEGPHVLHAGRLFGGVWELYGRSSRVPIVRRVVVLEDDSYLYAVRLDANLTSRLSRARRTFDDLVQSIVPIPESSATPKSYAM